MAIEQHRGVRSVESTRLHVSQNGRYFVNQDGEPFFYLADTAWTLFKRLTRSEIDQYLSNRASKGFTVIQAYVLRGLEVANVEGEIPLIDRDPSRLNEGFFRNVDYAVNRANELGLAMSLVATKGDHVHRPEKTGGIFPTDEAIFTRDSAFIYGKLLGARYLNNCVVWLLGGDRSPVPETLEIWDAMARGLKTGSNGHHLVSYHGAGGGSSSALLHDYEWLDFNTVQSRHRSADPNYEYVGSDYSLNPVKPTLDMEARYEDNPDGLWGPRLVSNPSGRIGARQVREAAYWSVFAGAAGHGYGHNSVWSMHDGVNVGASDYTFPESLPRSSWLAALDSSGAFAMGYLRKLVELRPWYEMVPDQTLIVTGQGEGEDHIQAAHAEDGSFALAYLPFGHAVVTRMDIIAGSTAKAQWFNPRDGSFTQIGLIPTRAMHEFVAPTMGEDNDWVLVIEDASKDWPIE